MEGIMAKVAELNLDFSTRFYVFVAGHFVLYYWMRYVVAPARPGWSRGVRAMILTPVLAIMCILFDAQKNEEATASVYSIATFLCMAPSKIICFCMNRGLIVKAYDSKSTLAFVLSLLFPVSVAFDEKKVTGKNEEKATEPHAYKDARFSVLRFEKTERWMRVTMLLFQTIGKVHQFLLPFASNSFMPASLDHVNVDFEAQCTILSLIWTDFYAKRVHRMVRLCIRVCNRRYNRSDLAAYGQCEDKPQLRPSMALPIC